MAEDFVTHFADFAASHSGEEGLSSEERRLMSLRNLAMSKASQAKKKRKTRRTGPQTGKITDAERRSQEQARIRKERASRSARTEENRRQAGIGDGEMPAPAPEPNKPKRPEPEKKPKPIAVPVSEEPEIDIALPEEEKPEKTGQPQVKSKRKKKTKQQSEAQSRATSAARYSKSGSPEHPNRITTGGAVTLGILTGVLIGTVIYGRVQTNEVYTKIAELQAEYDDLTARNISMKSEMEGKMTVKKIEEYAEDVLGLRPLNQSQIEYIQLQTEDAVTVSEPEDNFFVTVNDYLVSIWEFLRGR